MTPTWILQNDHETNTFFLQLLQKNEKNYGFNPPPTPPRESSPPPAVIPLEYQWVLSLTPWASTTKMTTTLDSILDGPGAYGSKSNRRTEGPTRTLEQSGPRHRVVILFLAIRTTLRARSSETITVSLEHEDRLGAVVLPDTIDPMLRVEDDIVLSGLVCLSSSYVLGSRVLCACSWFTFCV